MSKADSYPLQTAHAFLNDLRDTYAQLAAEHYTTRDTADGAHALAKMQGQTLLTLRDRIERNETQDRPRINNNEAEIERLNNMANDQAERTARHDDRLDSHKRLWQGTSTDLANLEARVAHVERLVEEQEHAIEWTKNVALVTATNAADLQIELDRLKQSAWSRFADWFARTSSNAWSTLLGTRR